MVASPTGRRPNPILARMEALMDAGNVEAAPETPGMKGVLSSNKGVLPTALPTSCPMKPSGKDTKFDAQLDADEEKENKPQADCSRRWLGHPPDIVDEAFLNEHSEDKDASGQPIAVSLRFLFLQEIPAAFSDGAGRNLVSLDLSSNNLRSLQGLTHLPRLLELKLYACELTSLEGLEAPKLIKLDISDNRMETQSLQGLRKFRTLEVLNIDKNALDSIDGVASIRLKELSACNNKLRSIGSALHRLSSLETLYIDDNRLGPTVNPACFRDVGNLTELSVRGNLLRGLHFLGVEKLPGELGVAPGEKGVARNQAVASSTLPKLQHLHAQRNEIANIVLPTQANLLELNLEDNLVEAVTDEFVSAFPCIESLYLARNRIATFADLEKLSDLEHLTELSILDNPWTEGLSDAPNRAKVLQRIPTLECLDDQMLEKLEQEKVVDPLMRCKGSSMRFYSESALIGWQTQQLKTLEAIDAQIQRTVKDSEQELGNMSKYLERCDAVLEREEKIRAREKDSIPEEGWSLNLCNEYNPVPTPVLSPVRDIAKKDNTVRRRIDSAKAYAPVAEEVPIDVNDEDVPPPLINAELLSEGAVEDEIAGEADEAINVDEDEQETEEPEAEEPETEEPEAPEEPETAAETVPVETKPLHTEARANIRRTSATKSSEPKAKSKK